MAEYGHKQCEKLHNGASLMTICQEQRRGQKTLGDRQGMEEVVEEEGGPYG